MTFLKKITTGLSALAVLAVTVASQGGAASAACNWQYTGQAMNTSTVPVFNSICGTPSFGDEDDFVRVRLNAGGASSANDLANYTNTVSSACNDGDRFDVLSYVHNDAEPASNATTGVAHNVSMTNSSPLGTTASNFSFSSRISASNAASVFDTASINCGGAPVILTLVPSSVMLNRQFTGGNWTLLADSAANGSLPISSDPSVSQDVPGCWNYRVAVAYTVVVRRPQQPQASGTCDMLSITAAANRTARVSGLNYTASNATVNGVTVTWGDGSSNNYPTVAAARSASHQYAKDGTYSIAARITFTANGQTFTSGGAGCAKSVTFSNGGGTTTPTTLPNTGAGSTLAIFAAVTAVAALAHRYFTGRRLSRG